MSFETVGSPETLLRLLATFQEKNGVRSSLQRLWREIVRYTERGGRYRFYILSDYRAKKPDDQFLADLAELVQGGRLLSHDDGTLEVTPFGLCLARACIVPPSLCELQENFIQQTPEDV